MIYKFKSKACGDLVMLGEHGDRLLRLLGREPAARGIFEAAAIPAVLATLEAAVAAETQAGPAGQDEAEAEAADAPVVTLRQRLWPMVEMLRQSHAAGHPVVWGV